MRRSGATVSLVSVPGGTHSTLRTKDAPDLVAEAIRWFNFHLRGAK